MRPIDCPSRDWALYYHGTFMIHDEMGIVTISLERSADGHVDGDYFYARAEGSRNGAQVTPESLTPVWPQGGAINTGGRAVYLTRRARREARRSCTRHHFNITWCSPRLPGSVQVSHSMIRKLAFTETYPTPEDALDLLRTEECTSVAISRDLILSQTPVGIIQVICRGVSAGDLVMENGRYEYVADVSDSPIARRVLFKLQKEGVLCLST